MTKIAIEPGFLSIPDGSNDLPKLLGSRCTDCSTVFHPQRRVCLKCYSQLLNDVSLDGSGTLYACTHVNMKLRPGQRTTREYWVGHIDLDAGPRIQGILAPDIGTPEIGMRVTIALETLQVDGEGNETVVCHFRREDSK